MRDKRLLSKLSSANLTLNITAQNRIAAIRQADSQMRKSGVLCVGAGLNYKTHYTAVHAAMEGEKYD